MTYKEILELKLQLLRDILNSMTFNFGSMDYTLNKTKLEDTIASYEQTWSDLYESKN